MSQFKVGDKVVYPAHGVAEVMSIETRDIGGKALAFYMLNILENGMRVMVPTSNVEQVGMREIVSSDEADKVFDVLKKCEKMVESTTWNRRHREYMEKIKTGSIFEIAEVLRNLFLLRHSKDLSFGERKMLDQAKHLLVKEISLAKKAKEEVIEQEIQTIFAS